MTRTKSLIQHIASLLEARENCRKSGNYDWLNRHTERLESLKQFLPSGSGFNAGTYLLPEASNPNVIKFHTSFHHMDESGGYAGWTEHDVFVRPMFDGLDIRVKGRNRNDIVDYIGEQFGHCLAMQITETAEGYSIARAA